MCEAFIPSLPAAEAYFSMKNGCSPTVAQKFPTAVYISLETIKL